MNYSRIKSLGIRYPVLYSPIEAIKCLIRYEPADNRMLLDANPMSLEELEKDADKWINGWKRQFSIQYLDAPISEKNKDAIAYNAKLLEEMISFCLERNLKPVIVMPPVTKALNSKFTEKFCELYIYSVIRDANKKEVPFLNYFFDDRFSDNKLFFNSFFLNIKGRRLFTETVLRDLRII
jgi:hypothetical protein